MIVYRLTRSNYKHDLTGKGAEMSGGRWNNKGTALVYTSESRALCMLEVAIHLPMGILPKDFMLVTIRIPDNGIHTIDHTSLDEDWKSNPPKPNTRLIGDTFVADGKQLVLKVPSVLVPDEYNFLINPKHWNASDVNILQQEPFTFDHRFFQR